MQVKFGLTLNMGTPSLEYSNFGKVCRFLDDSGFSVAWMGDEQSLRREIYVGMTVVALNSERLQLNVGPINPFTRHPAVTASAVSTLDELSEGRAALTVSRGFSNVVNVGLKPATLAQVEEYIATLKALWKDHETTFQGRTIRLVWPKRGVPLYMIAEGPRTMRLAGQIADGVIVGMGHSPEVIKATQEYIRQGAEEAGRRLEDLDIWWHIRWNIAEDYGTAVDELRGMLASAAGHALSYSFAGKLVPPEFQEPIRRIQAMYEHSKHGSNTAAHTAIVEDTPGLKQYLAKRFVIAGTVKQFIEQVETLADLGVTKIRLGVGGRERVGLLHTLVQQIMPRFQ